MPNNETTVDVYRLMTLLNEWYRSGQSECLIFSPYFKEPIFSIHLVPESQAGQPSQVKLLLRPREYNRFLEGVRDHGVRREVPDYGHVQDLLLQAGVVEYPNFKHFLAELQRLCQRDFHRGDRPVFLGLDTNLLRDRFYSAHFDILEEIPHNKIGFGVSPYVKDELTFDRKYKKRASRALREIASDRTFAEAVEKFVNQNCLEDRLRRLGWVEFLKVKRIHWIELLPELDERELESPDLNIIKTYKFAAAERNLDILLLSRDDAFIGHAQGIPGISTFQVERPNLRATAYAVPRWRNLCQLIYLSAVVFGAIRLHAKRDAFLIQGIWTGKGTTEWNRERVLISPYQTNTQAFARCRKAWRVLDALDWRPFA